MAELNLVGKIEAILFWRSEPTAVTDLAKMLGSRDAEVEEAVNSLENNLRESGRGLRLVRHNQSLILGTAAEASTLIERLTKEELSSNLGRAALEILAIICYLGPISRAEIDWIRGVNSSYLLRHLAIRGLADRKVNPRDQRSFIYTASLDTMAYLGVNRKENLPDFNKVRAEIENIKKS